jgi:hemin uptake protein HemP
MLNEAATAMSNSAKAATGASGAPIRPDDGSPRVVDSGTLLAGASQLAILHNQTVYFLRQTRFGKLILTK